jgi:AcrR family transcriptional regulator
VATNTRERIINASAELFRRQGYAGTGVKQIVAAAQAPFGSIYHHFPGGKEQIGAETIRVSGAFYALLIEAVIDPAPDLLSGIRDFFAAAAEQLRDSDYADACPIATVALEVASTSEPLRQATDDVFESWLAAISERLQAGGIAEQHARNLSLELLSLLEGAFILCRASRRTEALDAAGAAAAAAVEEALRRRTSTSECPSARPARAVASRAGRRSGGGTA